MLIQDLTLFGDDDETPILGAVDANGDPTEASFSTDPSHPRPWLKPILEAAEADLDVKEGKATIGQVNFEIGDAPRISGDQDSGIVTDILAGLAGESALIGRRVLIRQQRNDGTFEIMLNGVVDEFDLDDRLVTYSGVAKDIRERERRTRLFTNFETTSILPAGVVDGYGEVFSSTYLGSLAWIHPPIGGDGLGAVPVLTGVYRAPDADSAGAIVLSSGSRNRAKALDKVLEAGAAEAVYNDDGEYRGLTFPRIKVLWRLAGTANPWTEVREMDAYWAAKERTIENAFGTVGLDDNETVFVIPLRQNLDGTAVLPSTDGASLEFIVVHVGEPTEGFPGFIEDPWGKVLKDVLDGVYSDRPLGIRYDEAILADLAANTPRIRFPVTEPVEDAREWLEDNIFKPFGYAPALNERGEVAPISYALPDGSQALTTIDDSITVPGSARWGHRAADAVTIATFRYVREYISGEEGGDRLDRIIEKTIPITREAHSVPLLGEQTLEIMATGVRAYGMAGSGDPVLYGGVLEETGAKIGIERTHEIIDRFRFGAQRLEGLKVRKDAAGIAALNVGDWVRVSLSWLPNYETGRRGTDRIAQIVKVRSPDPRFREFDLLDGGPNVQPAGMPTLGAITVSTSGRVTVPITNIGAGDDARVDFAIAQAEPAADSPLWTYLGRRRTLGDLVSEPLPAGASVWIRGRGEAEGVRPSGWTAAVNVNIPTAARVSNVVLEAEEEPASVSWVPNPYAAGVRVYYAVHDDGADPVFSTKDVDASLGSTTVPVYPSPGERLTVEVEPWDGWTGAAVSGTAGPRVAVAFDRPDISTPGTPPRGFTTITRAGDLSWDVSIDGVAGRGGRGPVEAAYRVLIDTDTDAALGGAFSAWAPVPVSLTVSRAAFWTKILEFKLRDADGIESQVMRLKVPPRLEGLGRGGGRVRPEILYEATGGNTDGRTPGDSDEGARRAQSGLETGTGIVRVDVPLVYSVANVPGVSSTSGRIARTVAFDGVTETPEDTIEGRRRVDTYYQADAVLKPTVAARDPGGTNRGVGDASRRSILGLDSSTWATKVDVPLAFASANVPGISSADGRIDPAVALSGSSRTPGEIDTDAKLAGDFLPKNQQATGTVSAAGWYRIASNPGNRAMARFLLRDVESSRHNSAQFTLGVSYNQPQNASFALLMSSRYGARTFEKVRLLTSTTYATQYVEVYIADPAGTPNGYRLEIWDNIQDTGWASVAFTPGSIPSGYSAREWDIDVGRVADDTGANTSADTSAVDGKVAPDVRTHSDRAEAGLGSTGLVRIDVPLAYAAANVPAISTSDGKLDKGQPFSGRVDHPFSDTDRLATGVEPTADISGVQARVAARTGQSAVFFEDWTPGNTWASSGNLSILSAANVSGGKILRATGRVDPIFYGAIPFDPTKLYRIRGRVRKLSGDGRFYAGVITRDENGTYVGGNGGRHYNMASYESFPDGNWRVFTGWFKGHGAQQSGTGSTPDSPYTLITGTAFILPMMILEYNPTVAGSMDVDYFEITAYDDEAAARLYSTIDSGTGRIKKGVTITDPADLTRDLGDAARRTIQGLATTGVVNLGVPLVRAVANVPGIRDTDGEVDHLVADSLIVGHRADLVRNRAASGAQGSGLLKDPGLTEWTSGGNPPNGWGSWGGGVSRDATNVRSGVFSARHYSPDGSTRGMQALPHYGTWGAQPAEDDAEWLVVEVDLYFIGGNLRACGLLVDWVYSEGYGREYVRFADTLGDTPAAGWHTVRKTVQRPSSFATWDGMRLYCTANLSNFGAAAAVDYSVDRIQVREATQQEIAAAKALTTDGNIAQGATQSDGVAQRVIAKGHVAGTGLVNGSAVTFPQNFNGPPMVLLRGGVTYEPRSGQWSPSYASGSPQGLIRRAANLTVSGFDLVAKLVQRGTQTAQTDTFPVGLLQSVGDTLAVNLDPGGASGDEYTIEYDFEATTMEDMIDVTVAIDTNDGSGSGWIERATNRHLVAPNDIWVENGVTRSIIVSGLGLNDDIRLRIKAKNGVGGSYSVDPVEVRYATSNDNEATATPSGYSVDFEAMAVS